MAAEISVETVLCILVAAYVSQLLTVVTADNATPSPEARHPKISPEQFFVDETIRLITKGENNIRLDDSVKDVILVVGKTGSGKTTMTKFITEPEKLESYYNGERFLIRDPDDEISTWSNVIPKTTFPNLIIDNSTGNAFYDMPGFSDTRNASIEIASAWFMKTVAEHAERVKIVFVVTHSSLVRGGNRKDIVTLLKMATDFIKNPSKFKDSISLIATKVDEDADPEDIINDVGDFLESVKTDLRSVIEEPTKRGMASDLLDAFLVKYSNETYSRISFFLQPQNQGPLTAQDDVMELRHYMRRNLDNNTVFVATSPNDFGISLSHEAILSAAKVAQVMNQMIADAVTSIGKGIIQHFKGKKPSNSVGSFFQDLRRLEAFVDTFSPSMSRQEFIQELQVLVNAFKIPELQDQLTFIANRDKNLEFFEQVSRSGAFAPNIQEWFRPITIAIQASRSSFSRMVGTLNSHMTAVTNKLNSDFQHKIRREAFTIEDPNIQIQRLANFSQSLQQFLADIPSLGKSYNQFAAHVRSFLIYQGELPMASEFNNLTDDVPVQGIGCQIHSQLKLSKWLSPFESLLEFMEEEEIKLKIKALDAEKLKIMNELHKFKASIQSNASALITKRRHEISLLRTQRSQSENQSPALLAGLVANCNRGREHLSLLQAQELSNLRTTTKAEINALNASLGQENHSTVAEEALCNKTTAQLREDLDFTINSNNDWNNSTEERTRRVNRTSILKQQHQIQLRAYQDRCAKRKANVPEACNQTMAENKKRWEDHHSYLNTTIEEMERDCQLTIQRQIDICNQTLQSLVDAGKDQERLMEGKSSQQLTTCELRIKSVESQCNQKLEQARLEAGNKKSVVQEQIRKLISDSEDQILKLNITRRARRRELQDIACITKLEEARSGAILRFDEEKEQYLTKWNESERCCPSVDSKCLDNSEPNHQSNGITCCGVGDTCNRRSCCGCRQVCRLPVQL